MLNVLAFTRTRCPCCRQLVPLNREGLIAIHFVRAESPSGAPVACAGISRPALSPPSADARRAGC